MIWMGAEDELGSGSTQATVDEANNGKDLPFWNALNAYVPNLHAVISGHGEPLLRCSARAVSELTMMRCGDHGNEWCVREPTKNVIFCFAKHSGYVCLCSVCWGLLLT